MLVVGGGITGAGVALDAASRGLRTALVERDDFASGTSSKSLEARARRPALPPAARDPRSSTRTSPSASALLRNAPHLVRVLPFLIPIFDQGRADQPASSPRRSAPRCGCTTSPAACASASCHKRISKDEALAHMPTLRRRPTSPAAYLYYDAQADDARLTLDDRPHRRRARRGRRQLRAGRPGSLKDDDGRVDRRDGRAPTATTIDVRRAVGRQRHRRVGRRRARARRGRSTRTRSARPRASTSPCRGRRCATTSPSSSRSRRTAARSSSCRGATSPTSAPPTPTTTARSTTRSARPTTSTTCSARSTSSIAEPLTEADVARHVGRAAAARCARRRASAPPTSPAATPCARVRQRRRHDHRRQADDLPQDGRRHGRRGRRACSARGPRSRTKKLRAARRRGLRRRPPASAEPSVLDHLARRYGAEARRGARPGRRRRRARASRSCPGSPTCGPRPSTRCAHEMARTLDDVLVPPHPRPAARPRRVGGRRGRVGRALLARRARLGRRPSQPRQVERVPRPRVEHERTRAGLPGDRARRVARRVSPRCRRIGGAPTPPIALGGAAPSRSRPARGAARRGRRRGARAGSRSACADVADRRRRRWPRPSRDWWPLAMIWALDGAGRGAGRRGRPPGDRRRGRRPCSRSATRPASR